MFCFFAYNDSMERLTDKIIIVVCCGAVLFITPFTTTFIVGLLLAIALSAFQETSLLPRKISVGASVVYLIAIVVLPSLTVFIPLIAYDCLRSKNWVFRFSWIIPLVASARELSFFVLLFVAVIMSLACFLSWRTTRVEAERLSYRILRDELRELSLSLEQKNRELREKQDYEVKVAALAERGRIAREIHDNVGHLLTRSVLQIEAAQVLHANNVSAKEEFERVGETIREAFTTVRASVHDLHDESFDLHMQLSVLAQDSPVAVSLEYQIEDVPSSVGYGLIAVVREALANAVKHSDASRVQILATEYPAFWQLVIHDNGSVDPFKRTAEDASMVARAAGYLSQETTRGIGLKTMEERIRSFGGVFRLDYERGFRIFISIPNDGGKEQQ